MCRLTVTGLIWKGSANQMTPNELSEYNQLFRNYKPQARQTSQKYSSGKFSLKFYKILRPVFKVVCRLKTIKALIILYLLIFLQISPFLSERFTIHPKANTQKRNLRL